MSFPSKLFITRSGTDANAPATDGVAVSGANTYYSATFTGSNRAQWTAQVFWTGTPTGTLTVQWSDKPNPDETTDNDWFTDAATFSSSPAGAAGSGAAHPGANTADMGYRHRIKYVNASGTGVLTGFAHAPRNA